jgi:hypothetical protein
LEDVEEGGLELGGVDEGDRSAGLDRGEDAQEQMDLARDQRR